MSFVVGTGKSNPRKMVKVWAEKEMRNYRRIHAAGIPCPTPILLKSHILLMEFLGVNGWPSPRLKDAALQHKHMREAYVQTILIMRHMYQRCKLVHGDLSEYNLLWHNQQIYVIDVSQSVETHHPAALDFLRKDSSNVNDFFAKIGRLNVMTTRQLFEFVTTPGSGEEVEELEQLEQIMTTVEASRVRLEQASDQTRREQSQQESVDEAVFMSSFLPRSLNQVADYDIQQLENGQVEETYAHAVAALTGNQNVVDAYQNYKTGQGLGTADEKKEGADSVEMDEEEQGDGSEDSDDDSDDDDDDDDDDGTGRFSKLPKTEEQLELEKLEKRAQRKANKKTVREDKTEKRLTKLKKKDKKKAIKRAKAGNRKTK
jgi:RIO kinase 1